ncbi:MAG: phosphorylated adapter RNA export RNA-binding domain-containing protein [Chloroflexota bacterium]|nr:phosphorylated adapter RNA export RNA-binding domain-containing protein [Chloroflexota bacterium]
MTQHPVDEQAVQNIAQALGETDRAVIAQLRRAIRVLGVETTQAVVAEMQQIEAEGGMLTKDGSRRRTPGGVFFQLVLQRVPSRDRWFVFRHDQARRKGGRPPANTGAPAAVQPPFTLDLLPEIIAQIQTWGGAQTVKITVIGRPTQTVERGEVIILGLINETAPSLPKGLPVPPTPTKYVVLVARKQWQKVADALGNPDDRLIIEGYPTYAPQHSGITVYATSVTTKHLQAAKRLAQGSA